MFHLFLFLSFQIILRPGSTMPKTVTVADYLGSKHNPTDCNDTIMYLQIIVQILTNYFSNPFLSDTSKSSIQCHIVYKAKEAIGLGPPLLVVFMTLFQKKRRPHPCPR